MFNNTMNLASVKAVGIDRIRQCIKDGLKNDRSYCSGRLPQVKENMLRDAAVEHLWDRLEEAGLVKYETPADYSVGYSDMEGDLFDVDAHRDTVPGGERTILAQQKRYREHLDEVGVVGIVGYYRLSEDSEWVHADSIWGIEGDAVEECGYLEDIKYATILALRAKLKERCPCCRGKGVRG